MIQNKILEIDNSLTRVFYFFMCSSGLEKHLQSRQADVKMKHDQWLKTFRKIQRENRKGLDDMLSSLEAKMQEHAQKRKMAEFRQKKRQLNSAAIYIKRVAYPTLLSNQHPERPSVFYGGGNISADCIVDCAKEAIKAHEQQWNNFDDIMNRFEQANSKVVAKKAVAEKAAVSTGVSDQQASSSAAIILYLIKLITLIVSLFASIHFLVTLYSADRH